MKRMTRAVTLGLPLVLLAGTTSCSLRSDDRPRPIAKDAIPPALFQQNPSSTTTQPSNTETQRRQVYLVQTQGAADVLVPASVAITPPANPADLPRVVIERLINNPPVTDVLTSAIPPRTKIRNVTQNGDVLEIDLSNLGAIEGSGQRLAVAQIVYTATAIKGISGVRFFVDGSQSAVPLDDKSSAAGQTITRDDFPKLRPSAASSTTTSSTTPEAAPETTP